MGPGTIHNNGGSYRYDGVTATTTSVPPNDPDCTGTSHNVPFRFYCTVLAGFLAGQGVDDTQIHCRTGKPGRLDRSGKLQRVAKF